MKLFLICHLNVLLETVFALIMMGKENHKLQTKKTQHGVSKH